MTPGQEASSNNLVIFPSFWTIMVCCVYSLESTRRSDSNESVFEQLRFDCTNTNCIAMQRKNICVSIAKFLAVFSIEAVELWVIR